MMINFNEICHPNWLLVLGAGNFGAINGNAVMRIGQRLHITGSRLDPGQPATPLSIIRK